MYEIVSIIISFLLSLFLVSGTKRMSISFGVHDVPNGRKIHTEHIPTLGGLGIFIAVWLTVIMLDIFNIMDFKQIIFRIFAVSIAMFIMGIIDDVKGLSAKHKFTVQIISGALFFLWNNNNAVVLLGNPILSTIIFTILSMIFFTIMTNAVNFIDGLDGLCGGVSIIFSLTLIFFAVNIGNDYLKFLDLAVAGALFGFIIYNFYPAKIFMGDTGSLFLGGIFTMNAIIMIYLSPDKMPAFIILFTYLFIELGLTVIRRIIRHTNLFSADKSHIHHILKGSSADQRPAVIIIFLLNIFYSVIAALYFMTSSIFYIYIYMAYTLLLIGFIVNKMFLRREKE